MGRRQPEALPAPAGGDELAWFGVVEEAPAPSAAGRDAREEIARLREELARRRAVADRLRAELEEVRAREARGEAELERLRPAAEAARRAAEAERELDALRELLEITEQSAEAARDACRALEARWAEGVAGEPEAVLSALRDELEGLRRAFCELERRARAGPPPPEEIRALEARLAEREAELDGLRREAEAWDDERESREHRVRSAEQERERLATELAALEDTLAARDRETAALQRRLETARAAIAGRDEEIARLGRAGERTGERERALEARVDEALAALEAEREQTRRRDAEIERLQESLAAVGRALGHAAPGRIEAVPAERPAPQPPPPRPERHLKASHAGTPVEAEAPQPSAAGGPEPGARRGEPEPAAAFAEGALPAARGGDAMPTAGPAEDPLRAPPPEPRAPVFAAWRDAALRPLLSPLGVGGLEELWLREVTRLRRRRGDGPLALWSLGGPDADLEARLAARLAEAGEDDVRLVCLSHPSQIPARERAAAARGVAGRLVLREATTRALDAGPCDLLLADGALPAATASAGAISGGPDLDALAACLADDGRLVLAGPAGPPDAGARRRAVEIGDRIWALMPERYKRDHVRGRERERFDPGDEGEVPTPAAGPGLLEALPGRLEAEVLIAFGHLALSFVGPELGPNFDPGDERDRRFLEQLVALDAPRVASGALPPLELVAVLSPRADAAPLLAGAPGLAAAAARS